MGPLFRQAERDHLQSHREMRSWVEVDRDDPRVVKAGVLDDFVGQLGLDDISDRLEARVLDEYPDVDDEYPDIDDDCEMDGATDDA